MNKAMTIAFLLAASGLAHGQSVYVDIDATSGVGSGVPNPVFGGPAGIPGHWNSIYTTSPATVSLAGLDGLPTSVTVNRALNGTFLSTNSASTSGYYESLLDDYQLIASGTLTYTFNGLAPGAYMVFICGIAPNDSSNRSTISVNTPFSPGQATQLVGGAMPANTFKPGVTHGVLAVRIAAGDALTVTASSSLQDNAVVSGIQVVKIDDPSLRCRMYVNDTAGGANDGGSWTNAFTNLQDALTTASLAGGLNCEIWVSSGSYKPTTGTDRSATFSVAPGLRLLGGFGGSETALSQRTNPLSQITTLSGSIGGSGNTDDSYTVVTINNADSNTLVDGFYIARGSNEGAGSNSGHGGGMAIVNGTFPIIRNCDFTTNRATGGGAALYTSNSSVRIGACTFYNSDCTNGAGGAIEAVNTGSTTVHNSRFLGNTAIGDGGAIYSNGGYLNLVGCLFSGNSTSSEGGAIKAVGTTQTLTMTNCTVSKNSSSQNVGGVYGAGGLDVSLYNTILWGNTASIPNSVDKYQITTQTFAGSTWSGTYNSIEGLNANPQLVNAAGADGIPGNFDDDCRLMQGSPCINAGDNSSLPVDQVDVDGDGNYAEALPVDLNGNPRRVAMSTIANTGAGSSPMVDRGAYEFQASEFCYGNCDNSVVAPVLNVADFTCFLQKYAAGDPYANCDASVQAPVLNVADFTCFLQKYAAGCP